MKKFLPILLILAATLPAFADVVPMSRAKANAEQFLRQADPARTPQLKLLFEEPKLTKADPADPEYFIFTDERGGFVIAGGDDTVPEILGYSTSSTIPTQGMPENMKAWLEMWSRIVDGQRLSGAGAYQPRPARRGTSPKVLETALWDQDDPYNRHCIEMGGKRAVTGCTATAAAIMMRYYKWPEKGTGTLPGYSVADPDTGKSYNIDPVELGRTYDWDLMPLTKYDGTWTEEQMEAVSWLMSDLGIMIQSEYSPSGTGASIEDMKAGLVAHMHYDASMRLAYRQFYDADKWIALLEDNIDRFGPIEYAGFPEDYSMGHAFVLSGYDEYDNFYINWGWSGSGNGYFVIPDFKEYVAGHRAILCAGKDAGGQAQEDLNIANLGLSSPSSSFATGVPFTVSCTSVFNYSSADFSGDLAFAKFDRDGRMVEVPVSGVGPVSITAGYGINLNNWDCQISTPILPGDYVALVYRSDRTPDWTPVGYDHEGMTVGKLAVGDTVFLDEIVSLEYNSSQGLLTVSFTESASCELRKNGTPVTTGVTVKDNSVEIDARQLPLASYTLHLERGKQTKDITLKFGLK